MADEKKKTKIDLKARLGKTQTGMGSSVPLPVPGATPSSQPGASAPPSSDGVPPPVVPPSVPSVRPSAGGVPAPISAPISPGIPLPPFAQPRASQREPAAKPTAAQQTIVVEVGEEIHQERKKATRRTALFAALALLLGVGIGFVVGGARETRARVDLAIKSAGDLEKEVKGSNEKISEIGEKLKDAAEKLGRKDFPADLAGQLAGLVVPFETGNLDKPGVGSMGKTLKPLMRYTAAVEALNSDREQLKNVLTQLQPQVEKAWKEEKEPVVSYSVIFRPEGSKGMVAELVPNKDPFKIGADFPKEYPIFKPEMVAGKLKAVEKKAKRWEKGDLTASDPIAIPVSPQTTSFLEEKVVPQLQLKVIEQLEIIYGKFKGTPQETQGLLKDGEDLEHELHKVSLAR